MTGSSDCIWFIVPLLVPALKGTRTIALDPTFESFTVLGPMSYEVNPFLW
jgi:hypothetical protein